MATSTEALVDDANTRVLATPNPDLLVLKTGKRRIRSKLTEQESAAALLGRLARVIESPGLARDRVFSAKGVYAYSVSPSDPTKIVREDAGGRKTVGTLVGGRFRALRSKKA